MRVYGLNKFKWISIIDGMVDIDPIIIHNDGEQG